MRNSRGKGGPTWGTLDVSSTVEAQSQRDKAASSVHKVRGRQSGHHVHVDGGAGEGGGGGVRRRLGGGDGARVKVQVAKFSTEVW